MIIMSTGLKKILLASGNLKATFDPGSEIRIFGGDVPATADASIGSAELLLVIKNGVNGITFDAAPTAAGILEKNPTEDWGGNCVGTGTPSFYRHVLTADTNAASTSAPRYQGLMGVVGADMNLTTSTLVTGAPQELEYHMAAF